MNVKERLKQIIRCGEKCAVPLCFYPARKLIGASMEQILSDSEAGANCLLAIREKFHPSMLVRMTELWMEAEAFGAEVEISENDFPSIKGAAVEDISDVSSLNMPSANHGRLEVFVDMMLKAKSAMPNELLFAGVTGPFSLCGCLSDAQELMMSCYADSEAVHEFLEKVTQFLIQYCNRYKEAGISGVFIAEPSICMISPEMAKEFSHDYIKKIVDTVQCDDFAVVYHNCGDVTVQLEDIRDIGAMAYHFADAVPMQAVLESFPSEIPILGNIHPVKFMKGSEASLSASLKEAGEKYGCFANFVLSSGCDMAPQAQIAAIEMMF